MATDEDLKKIQKSIEVLVEGLTEEELQKVSGGLSCRGAVCKGVRQCLALCPFLNCPEVNCDALQCPSFHMTE